MEKSNDRRESVGPTNILGLAVSRRKEAAEAEAATAAADEDAAYEDDEEYCNKKYDDEEYDEDDAEDDAEDEAFNAASAKGASSTDGSSQPSASKAGTSNVGSSSAASLPAGNPKPGCSSSGISKTGPPKAGHQSAGSSKQASSASGRPTSGTGPLNPGHSNTNLSNTGASQASVRPSGAGHPNARCPSAPSSNVGPSNANISASRVAPFNFAPSNVSLDADYQRIGHINAAKTVNNPTIKLEAGQTSEGVKLAPIRADQSLNLPLPCLTNPASSPTAQIPNVGSSSTFLPSAIPAPGAISGPQITRPTIVPTMNYFSPSATTASAATVSAATSLTSMMIPQSPQPPNSKPSQTEDGPVVLDITSLRCFFGVVDQGLGPTSLNDKLFSRPDFFFPIRTPTFPTPYGLDASRANESQTQAPSLSLPSLSSLCPVPFMLAGRPFSPATMDKGKKRKRVSGSGDEMEDDTSGKDKGRAE